MAASPLGLGATPSCPTAAPPPSPARGIFEFEHAAVAGALPRHHDDPFDRMLVAHAQCEGLTLLTSDPRISSYAVAVLPAS
jgi:hypothetical protein